jgi:hypothetical protein
MYQELMNNQTLGESSKCSEQIGEWENPVPLLAVECQLPMSINFH